MENPFVRKLDQFARLSDDEKAALERLSTMRIRQVEARLDIVSEGDKPHYMHLIMSGWAYRYKQLEDGRRQILAYVVPGDMCDLNDTILQRADHSLGAMTAVSCAQVSRAEIEALTTDRRRVAEGLWWETLVNAAIQREWTLNLGQRNAFERIGHLFCELFIRLRGVGLTDHDTCSFPVTQADLADTTGLSAVHVNRTLQEMRAANLIVLKGKNLTIPDLPALARASLFNADYLHLDHVGRELDAHDT